MVTLERSVRCSLSVKEKNNSQCVETRGYEKKVAIRTSAIPDRTSSMSFITEVCM